MEFELKENIITAFGNIEEGDGAKFISIFSELERKYASVIIKLHTFGGSVFDGNMMYNAIAGSVARVTIYIVGVAASMGAVLSLSVDEVYMVENGYLMIHAPSVNGSGTAKDLESSVKLLKLIETNFIKKLQQKTGKSAEYLQNWLSADTWFDAEQALNEGLIKGITAPEVSFEKFDPRKLPTQEAFSRFNASFNSKKFNNKYNMDLRKSLINKFDLLSGTSDTKIIQEVEQRINLRLSIIELLKLDKGVSDDEILEAIKTLLDEKQASTEEQEQEARLLITQARSQGLITAEQESYLHGMLKKDFKGAKHFLKGMSKPQTNPFNISALIRKNTGTEETLQGSNSKPKSEWDIEDYRKYDPKELERNPQLYKRLIEEKYNK